IHLLAGELDQAIHLALDAVRMASEQKERGNQAYARLLLAECRSRDSSDATDAEQLYNDALALTTELGMLPLAAHCHAGLWRLHRRMSERPKGEPHLVAASA